MKESTEVLEAEWSGLDECIKHLEKAKDELVDKTPFSLAVESIIHSTDARRDEINEELKSREHQNEAFFQEPEAWDGGFAKNH